MRIAAAHQPTFLPWLGWWDKLVRADVLVLLDDVQFPKTGGTWMNRVRVLRTGEPVWLTVPVDRAFSGVRSVRETLVDASTDWRAKVTAFLRDAYRDARRRDEVLADVGYFLATETSHLAELNDRAIRRIAGRLGVDTAKLVKQSDLGVTGVGNELLVDVCRAVGADIYLTGDGAGDYLRPEVFDAAGVRIVEQQFAHPVYPQAAARFVPGLSVVDAAMSCGWDGAARLLSR